MMQANILKREIMQQKTIYDSEVEASVVSDIVLPENLGDIERILKCTFTPRLTSKAIEGSRLCLQGSGVLRMVYKTSDGKLESFETQSPFSKNIDLPQTSENMCVSARTCSGFCSCRALSERRFEMNAGVNIKVKVCALNSIMMPIGAEEEHIEVRQKNVSAIIPVCFASENFTVIDEYQLSNGPIKSVLKTSATPSVSEYKIVSGKIIVKGNVDFCITYVAEGTSAPTRANYSIPVTHVLSCVGAEETDIAEVTLSVCRISAESGANGDKGELSLEMLLQAEAEVCREESLSPVVDAYCVGYESRCTHQNIALPILKRKAEKAYSMNLPIETGGADMLDAFADIKRCSARVNEQGEIMMSAEALVSALCQNSEGDYFLIEKSAPIEFSIAADSALANSELEPFIALSSVVPNKNSVGLNMMALCAASKKQSIPMLSEIEIMTDTPKKRNPKTALTIYFANEGEDSFDIGKRYNTSHREIMLQNSLSDAVIPEDMTILIPMTR